MTTVTTVKEMKEWLDKFPDETIVQVSIQQEAGTWDNYGPSYFRNLKVDEEYTTWEYVDFKGNKFVKTTDPHYNKSYLQLGTVD